MTSACVPLAGNWRRKHGVADDVDAFRPVMINLVENYDARRYTHTYRDEQTKKTRCRLLKCIAELDQRNLLTLLRLVAPEEHKLLSSIDTNYQTRFF